MKCDTTYVGFNEQIEVLPPTKTALEIADVLSDRISIINYNIEQQSIAKVTNGKQNHCPVNQSAFATATATDVPAEIQRHDDNEIVEVDEYTSLLGQSSRQNLQ